MRVAFLRSLGLISALTIAAAAAYADVAVVDRQISASSDDAMQIGNNVDTSTTDLPLGRWTVGVRFANVTVPQGAPIASASIEFVAAADDNQNTDIVIRGED